MEPIQIFDLFGLFFEVFCLLLGNFELRDRRPTSASDPSEHETTTFDDFQGLLDRDRQT